MTDYIEAGGLRIARELDELVRQSIAPGTGIGADTVWQTLGSIVAELGPRQQALLHRRDELQSAIDDWFAERRGSPVDVDAYRGFLEDIGYLLPEGEPFSVTTANVDGEIASQAGPQLVVPVDKARYALNAANARWGSLYDALYGTDVIPPTGGAAASGYDPLRGERVIAWTNGFLDATLPLERGSWSEVTGLALSESSLVLTLAAGGATKLADETACVGFAGDNAALETVLFRHNGLHIELEIDPEHPIGRQHPAGIRDVVLESAISTIMDCEDSVAAVDAGDKALVYANWAGIMRGDLKTRFDKAGKTIERRLQSDRSYSAVDGGELHLPGRSLLLVRHVGGHVLTDAVTTASGEPIHETFLDCVVTVLGAMHDLKGNGPHRNSRAGSVYIVKPKQHGPDEVELSVELFARVESAYGLPPNTLKIGGSTTVNLMAAQGLHQYGIPRSHRGRDSYAHGSGPDDPQARDQVGGVDARLRGLERRCRARGGTARACPDRQGNVGHAGRDGGDARHQGRPPGGRRELRLGPLADGGDAARDPLPPRRCQGAPARARRPRAREPDRPPDAAAPG